MRALTVAPGIANSARVEDVAELQFEVWRKLAQRLCDRSFGGFEEILSLLIGHDQTVRTDGSQQSERQRPRPRARFDNARSRMDVGPDQDGAEILRIDRLRLPHATRHLLGECRPHGQQPRSHLGRDDDSFRTTDELVVIDRARMK